MRNIPYPKTFMFVFFLLYLLPYIISHHLNFLSDVTTYLSSNNICIIRFVKCNFYHEMTSFHEDPIYEECTWWRVSRDKPSNILSEKQIKRFCKRFEKPMGLLL